MQKYKGYTENGVIVPVGNISLPDGLNVDITVLDEEHLSETELIEKRLKFIDEFYKAMEESEPLPPEFDEIINQRINLRRNKEL
jgi:predicted DNA-binding antitoxin AbrB/MazE fold protein